MKPCIFVIIFVVTLKIVNAQILSGKVFWSDDEIEIPCAKVSIVQNDSIIIQTATNLDGEFELNYLSDTKSNIHVDGGKHYIPEIIPLIDKKEFYKIKLIKIFVKPIEERYNKSTAKEDLKNGNIYLLKKGIILHENELIINKITKKYGFRYYYLGCLIEEGTDEAINRYNKIVIKHLNKVNKKNWQLNMKDELKQIKTPYNNGYR